MTDSRATYSTSESLSMGGSAPIFYMNFQFYKLHSDYRRLMTNEKVVAKQDFMAAFDSVSDRMPIATYALTGLRSDCDLLIWRVTPHIKDLQAMSAQLQSSGIGKYFSPVLSLTGTVTGSGYRMPEGRRGAPKPPPSPIGAAPYLVVQPVVEGAPSGLPKLVDNFTDGVIHAADSAGLDGQQWILACETGDPLKYREWAKRELASVRTGRPYVCLRGPMREIVDSFG